MPECLVPAAGDVRVVDVATFCCSRWRPYYWLPAARWAPWFCLTYVILVALITPYAVPCNVSNVPPGFGLPRLSIVSFW